MACEWYRQKTEKNLYADLVKAGKFELLKTQRADYEETAFLKCTPCGQRWKYTFTDSFHFPIVTWTKTK